MVTNRTVSKVARQLLSVDLGAEEEEEDEEEEEEAAAATEEESSAVSSSSEEEADGAGVERVSFRSQRPSPPDCEALGELALYLRMVSERLKKNHERGRPPLCLLWRQAGTELLNHYSVLQPE